MKSLLGIFVLVSVLGICLSCQRNDKLFTLLKPSESGITFRNELYPTDDLNILTYLYYYNGAGVALADLNNDGLNDIYFTSNQGADKLYLNKGALKFEDVTERAGIENASGWSTGVTHVDINGDGLLDIYVCKVGAYKSIQGSNLLFLNQGFDENKIPTFEESARQFGLDIVGFSTQAVFFDYDLDGDLDMFLLSHSVHPNHSYGRGESRMEIDSLAGDKLYENVDGFFKDVSIAAGLFQGKTGYGLGVSVGDLNKDGYPDIYVGNDFFENDYLYQNNGNKTFTELNSIDPRILGHTSHYSMGNCIADVNNDGYADIMSLDMLPENLITLKSSGVEDGFSTYQRFLRNGYAPQYMQNTLHLNSGNGTFSEVGFQSGIAATEWSWGILAADLDLDGQRDLYVTNGIPGATNDMDYINYISQDQIQNEIGKNNQSQSLNFAKNIPEKKVNNFAFKNSGNVMFTNVSGEWFEAAPSFSSGGAHGDLDNDGDLDLVISNINQEAFIFINETNVQAEKNSLTIKFRGTGSNTFGIGAKVEVFSNGLYLYEENFPVRSYLSAVPNEILFGLGPISLVDSIRVSWPDSNIETIFNVESNKTVLLDHKNSQPGSMNTTRETDHTCYLSNTDLQLDFVHHEEPTLDFDRDPLIPFALSNDGPGIGIADVNGDSLNDIFISGAKMQSSQLFIQSRDGKLVSTQLEVFDMDAKSEDVDQVFFDADNDLDMDLLVVSGGNEFVSGDPLKPRLYINDGGRFSHKKSEFEGVAINASVIKAFDFDNDGDMDIVVGANALPRFFGQTAKNYIFENDGSGHFKDVTEMISKDFQNVGLITDIEITDIDGNGYSDLIALGTWIPVTLYMNNGERLTPKVLDNTEGWWKSIAAADFDNDGDVDLVAGNWGMNSRLTASEKEPIKMYRYDFDDNGDAETLITYFYHGHETFLSSRDELAKQMPFIKKKFSSYREFANASVTDVFDKGKLSRAITKEAMILATCYFENTGNENFKRHWLPPVAQQSTVNSILIDDIDNDGYLDLLMVGNNYEISTQLGRLDASHGVLLLNDRAGFFKEVKNQKFNISGPARDIKKVILGGAVYYLVAINNDKPVFIKKRDNK